MAAVAIDRPIRLGVFHTISQAQEAISGLVRAGFAKTQITVLCSDRAKEDQFREYEHQILASDRTLSAVKLGASIGAGAAACIAVAMAGMLGWGGLSAGAVMIPAGTVFGAMIGAMMIHGMEKELAEFYELAVVDGEILVAAEDHSERHGQLLVEAERVLSESGAHPVALAEA
jgi:hypothetical protein